MVLVCHLRPYRPTQRIPSSSGQSTCEGVETKIAEQIEIEMFLCLTARCISSTWESANNGWQDLQHSSWHPFDHNTVSIATFFSAIALFPVSTLSKKGQSKNEAVGWRIHSLASAYGKRQKHRYFRTREAEADLAYRCAWTQRWKVGDHACKTQSCIHLESIHTAPARFEDNVLLGIEMRRCFEIDNYWWHHHLPAMKFSLTVFLRWAIGRHLAL